MAQTEALPLQTAFPIQNMAGGRSALFRGGRVIIVYGDAVHGLTSKEIMVLIPPWKFLLTTTLYYIYLHYTYYSR